MKSFKLAFILFAVLGLGSQLEAAATLITVVNSKKAADETRDVSGFHGISSSGSYLVTVILGNTESLKLEGTSEQLALVETVVEDGILNIRTKKQVRWEKNNFSQRVRVYVTAKSLRSLNVSGSGNIDVKNTIKGDELVASISGSGKITIDVDVENFQGSIGGSGGINAKGKADNAKISVNGSGDFHGKSLVSNVTGARVAGSGSIYIGSDKSLDASVTGSGSVYYSGNANVKSHKSGSGRIARL